MKVFSRDAFKRNLHYDWLMYVLSGLLAIGLWSWAFAIMHRPKSYERLDFFIACEIKNQRFTELVTSAFEADGLKLIETNQALPNDTAFQSKLQVVGYNSSDLLILPESIFENILFDEVFLPIDILIKQTYLNEVPTLYSYQGIDYGILLRGGIKTSWLDEYLNFDVNDNYYLFVSGASQNIADLGNYDTPEYDLALKVLPYIIKESL